VKPGPVRGGRYFRPRAARALKNCKTAFVTLSSRQGEQRLGRVFFTRRKTATVELKKVELQKVELQKVELQK